MNDEEILKKAKNLLGMGTNTANDDVLSDLISVVKSDMADSGVSDKVINSKNAIGTIVRGVIDNWNYGTGADYSKMYTNGVIKLRAKPDDSVEEIENNEVEEETKNTETENGEVENEL